MPLRGRMTASCNKNQGYPSRIEVCARCVTKRYIVSWWGPTSTCNFTTCVIWVVPGRCPSASSTPIGYCSFSVGIWFSMTKELSIRASTSQPVSSRTVESKVRSFHRIWQGSVGQRFLTIEDLSKAGTEAIGEYAARSLKLEIVIGPWSRISPGTRRFPGSGLLQ